MITNLNDSGYEACHILAVSSHKSESAIKAYATKCPDTKKRQMCETLAGKLLIKKPKIEATSTVTSAQSLSRAAVSTSPLARGYYILGLG